MGRVSGPLEIKDQGMDSIGEFEEVNCIHINGDYITVYCLL